MWRYGGTYLTQVRRAAATSADPWQSQELRLHSSPPGHHTGAWAEGQGWHWSCRPGPFAEGELCNKIHGKARVNSSKTSCPIGSLKTVGCYLLKEHFQDLDDRNEPTKLRSIYELIGFSSNLKRIDNFINEENEEKQCLFSKKPTADKDIHNNFIEGGMYDQRFQGIRADGLWRCHPPLTWQRCTASWGDQLSFAEETIHRHSPPHQSRLSRCYCFSGGFKVLSLE